jgi:RNA polymerase-binding transcription factor DksA
MNIHIQELKKKLEEEKMLLETALNEIGQKNSDNPSDWEGKPENIDEEHADKNDVADNIEEYETNTAVVSELEFRLKNIDTALEKIGKGTFGICRVCGEQIEEDRLFANPSAETCKKHLND